MWSDFEMLSGMMGHGVRFCVLPRVEIAAAGALSSLEHGEVGDPSRPWVPPAHVTWPRVKSTVSGTSKLFPVA